MKALCQTDSLLQMKVYFKAGSLMYMNEHRSKIIYLVSRS